MLDGDFTINPFLMAASVLAAFGGYTYLAF